MTDFMNEYSHFIFDEMMVHPAFFTHTGAEKIAILSNKESIANEVLKHESVVEAWQIHSNNTNNEKNSRLILASQTSFNKTEPNYFDIIITTELTSDYQKIFQALKANGMFVQPGESVFQPAKLKTSYNNLKNAGFSELQLFHFPQPGSSLGWNTAIVGIKEGHFKRIREKDIFNKPFSTRYYNFDIHKASMVMPEFMREELAF